MPREKKLRSRRWPVVRAAATHRVQRRPDRPPPIRNDRRHPGTQMRRPRAGARRCTRASPVRRDRMWSLPIIPAAAYILLINSLRRVNESVGTPAGVTYDYGLVYIYIAARARAAPGLYSTHCDHCQATRSSRPTKMRFAIVGAGGVGGCESMIASRLARTLRACPLPSERVPSELRPAWTYTLTSRSSTVPCSSRDGGEAHSARGA